MILADQIKIYCLASVMKALNSPDSFFPGAVEFQQNLPAAIEDYSFHHASHSHLLVSLIYLFCLSLIDVWSLLQGFCS